MADFSTTPASQRSPILPNFILIGAGRSGTTFLYYHLQQHPEIHLKASKRPEPHFFARKSEYEKGLAYYSKTVFSEWSDEPCVGEASTSTLYSQEAPSRMARDLPEVRLVCLLRNPVDRMFSEYRNSVAHGWEDVDFEQALRLEAERLRCPIDEYHRELEPKAYVKRGLYAQHLRRWYEHFTRERVFVGLFEAMRDEPRAFLRSVFEFLDVDASFPVRLSDEHDNPALPAADTLDPGLRARLLERFRAANQDLTDLLQRSLADWNA